MLRDQGTAGMKRPNDCLRMFQLLRAGTNRHTDSGVQEEAAAWRAAEERPERPVAYRSAEFTFLFETGPEDHI